MRSKILIIDSDKKSWLGLKRSLAKKRYDLRRIAVDHVDSRDKAFDVLDHGDCFLIFLELELPEQSGALLMEEIYQSYPHIPIAIITEQESLDAATRAFRCNVIDYRIKPVATAVLQHLVYRALGRYSFKKEKEQIIDNLESSLETLRNLYGMSQPGYHEREETLLSDSTLFDIERGVLIKDDSETVLTPIERTLLSNFLEHPGRVFSIDEVWYSLYGEHPKKGTDPRELIRTNVHRLRKKLESINNEKDWVRSVRGEGYTFEP